MCLGHFSNRERIEIMKYHSRNLRKLNTSAHATLLTFFGFWVTIKSILNFAFIYFSLDVQPEFQILNYTYAMKTSRQ